MVDKNVLNDLLVMLINQNKLHIINKYINKYVFDCHSMYTDGYIHVGDLVIVSNNKVIIMFSDIVSRQMIYAAEYILRINDIRIDINGLMHEMLESV